MMKKTQISLLLALLVSSASAFPVWAELAEVSLDNGGRLLRIHTAPYGELFPEGTAAAPDAPVVALEVQWANNPSNLLLVPGTEDQAMESEARIFWDAGPGAAILLWLTGDADGPKTLDLQTVRQGGQGIEWSERFQALGTDSPELFAAWPDHIVTQDENRVDIEDGETQTTRRTLVHLLWKGEDQDAPTTFYTALAFTDGSYAGANERIDLGSAFLLAPEETGDDPPPALTPKLAGTAQILQGQNPSSILIALSNPATQRLGTLEVDIMPLQLSTLGDLVRDEAYAAADAYNPGDIQVFADEMKAGIVIIGFHLRLHPAVTDYLANEMEQWIQDEGAAYGYSNFPDLGDDARELTLQLTSSVYASTISDPFDPNSTTVEIGLGDFLDNLEPGSAQRIGVRERLNLPAPLVGDGETWIFTSSDGSAVLVAWLSEEEPDTLRYVESEDGQTWSDPLILNLSERLSTEQALQLLQDRLP